MTAKERNEIQAFFNRFSEFNEEESRAFKKLQEMNKEHGSGEVWCSASANLECIIRECEDQNIVNRAKYVYDEYTKARGKIEVMWEIGRTLAEIGFWKKKEKEIF